MWPTAGVDYNVPGFGSQFNINFPAGTSARLFPVSIINDNFLEIDETFSLTITQTNSTVVTPGSQSTATVTIRDDDG